MAYLFGLGLLAFLVVTGGRLSALSEPSLSPEEQWAAFKKEYNKTYPNQAEHDHRKQIFLEDLAFIEDHNTKQYNLSDPNAPHYKLGINKYCELFLNN